MRLFLVRHGDAYAGLHGVIAGPRGCRGLTDLGRRQAALLRDHLSSGGHLKADILMTSELPRAIETAQIIAPALGIEQIPQDCDLCEVHTGEADGMDWSEHTRVHGPFDMAAEPDRLFAPGGDSWNSFNDRVESAMQRLATEHVDQTVVAVCHAGVIAASLAIRFGLPNGVSDVRLLPSNTGVTHWDYDSSDERWTLRSYNDTSHLSVESVG